MELPQTNQGYLVTQLHGLYHIARIAGLSLCGHVWITTRPGQRRRFSDWNVVTEKPTGQFVALCSLCERIATGAPEPTSRSIESLYSRVSEMWPTRHRHLMEHPKRKKTKPDEKS